MHSLFLTKVVSMSSTQSSNGLEQGLKPRHVTMLSIAGVIGAGLFVGSGHAIAAAGGAGVALLPDYLANEYGLIPVSPGGTALTQDIWLSVHEDVRHTRRIGAVLDFLTACIEPAYRL